jgi:hypothetical protein
MIGPITSSKKVCRVSSGMEGGIQATFQWRFVRRYQSENQREQNTELNGSDIYRHLLNIKHLLGYICG